MELSKIAEDFGGQAQLATALGVDRSQINRVIKGSRKLGPTLAVRIFNLTGHKLGPLSEDWHAA
jgi:plasmid maintenance system antidote protein VapI